MPPQSGCIILLNGFPGVGKLTIAQHIKEHLQSSTPSTAVRLIDNHVLIDPCTAVIPERTPAHYAMRYQIRQVAFSMLAQEYTSNPNMVTIMTSCLADTERDTTVLEEHFQLAKASAVPLYMVDVTCDREEHLCRFRDPCRYGNGKTKLRDESVLDQLLVQHVLCREHNVKADLRSDVVFKRMVLVTTGNNARESGRQI
jgi:hypothetical protein